MGTAPPRMLAARAYDVGPDAMAFDVDVQWESELVAEIEMVTKPLGARVPVSVRNVRFEGTVRAVLTPLVAGGPGYGAMLLSLPAPPALKMEVRVVGGEITKVPWLKLELEKYLLEGMNEVCCLPLPLLLTMIEVCCPSHDPWPNLPPAAKPGPTNSAQIWPRLGPNLAPTSSPSTPGDALAAKAGAACRGGGEPATLARAARRTAAG